MAMLCMTSGLYEPDCCQAIIFSHREHSGVLYKEWHLLKDNPATRRKHLGRSLISISHSVYRYLVHCTGDGDDAQELFQDTFLRAHRAYTNLPTDANHRAWLFRIATNLVKNYIRGRQRYRKVFVATSPYLLQKCTRQRQNKRFTRRRQLRCS